MTMRSLCLSSSRKKISYISLLSFLVLLGCFSCSQKASQNTKIVAATIYPIADWCRNITPESITIETIIPPNYNPHAFEPGVQQAKDLHAADVVVRVGYGFDDWIESFIKNTANASTTILVLENAEAEEVHTTHIEDEHHGHDHDHDHGHGHGQNPHLWLDPIWAQEAVRTISEQLQSTFPEEQEIIAQKTREYLLELNQLHLSIAEQVQDFTYKEYIGYHGAFEWFAKRYGLVEVASIEPWSGKKPSVEQVKKIVGILKEMENPVIFVEPQQNRKTAEIFAQEGNCAVYELDPLGDPQSPQRESYIKIMQFNVQSLKNGLNPNHAE